MSRSHPPDQAHTPEHEVLLVRIVSGELDPEAPEVLERIESCAQCRQELEDGLLPAQQVLEEWSKEEQLGLERAMGEIEESDEQLVARSLESIWERERDSSRLFSWGGLVALAAAVLLVFTLWKVTGTNERETPIFLEESDARCLHPVGEVDEFAEFRWRGELVGDESYTLVIWSGESVEPVMRFDRLREARFELNEQQRAQLQRKIQWQVQKYDEQQSLIDSFEGYSSLR